MAKRSLGRKDLFGFTACQSPASREVRTGTLGKATDGCCPLLTPHGLLSLLSHSTQDHQPRSATAQSGLGPPMSILNQETHRLAQGQLGGAFSQLRFSLPR